MMKAVKKIIAVILLLPAASVMAAGGPYDGIWQIPPFGYTNISENNGTVVAVNVYNWEWGGDWEAYIGPRNGNTIRLTTIVNSDVVTVFNVIMTSDTTFTATQESCIPANLCDFPDGFAIQGTKIW